MLPHLIWEQSATYTLAAICIRTCRLFGKSSRNIRLRKLCEIPPRDWCRNTLMLSSRPPVAAVGSCTMRDLVDEAVVQGHAAQNNYYSVKWNWTGSVASEPNVESAVGSTETCEKREFCTVEPSCFWKFQRPVAGFAELTWTTWLYSDKSQQDRL